MAPVLFKSKNRTVPIFLLLLSGCAGTPPPSSLTPAPLSPVSSPFKEIPPGKNLRALPQFLLVDDFSEAGLKNRFGFPWEAESAFEVRKEPPPGRTGKVVRYLAKPIPLVGTVIRTPFRIVKGAIVEEETKAPMGRFRLRRKTQDSLQKRGGSLSFKASLNPGVKVIFKSSLKGLDASQAQALVLQCRVGPPGDTFSGRMELALKDTDGREGAVDLTSLCLSGKDSPNKWQEPTLPRSLYPQINWNRLDEISIGFSAGAEPLRVWAGIDEIAFYGKGNVEFLSRRDNLAGFPVRIRASGKRAQLLAEPESGKFLQEIARDTWKYFENALDRTTQLPVDHIRVGEPGDVGAYTTPTNLAMYFLACVAAHELGFISKKEAVRRIQKTLETLRRIKRWKGFHYNFYNTTTLQVTRNYVSAVDSGWLAAAWIVIRQAFPGELGPLVTQFLNEINFNEFYDDGIGQIRLGYDGDRDDLSPYHYGLIATEARVASFIGIGKGDLPREHWWFIYRTPPAQWTWQSQTPQGREVKKERVTFFQGYYTYQGKKFVPSWGGSLFEFLMPTLVMKERELAPKSFGLNNLAATEIQIDYALNRQGYSVWGISPASTASGRQWRYGEYGVKYLGVKGYRDEGILSPHAAILALDTLPEHVIDNLREMLRNYEIYGEYGFYDSINVRNGRVNTQYLALDQGMILAAIANYLKKGVIQEYFHRDEIAKKAESLLGLEEWFD